MDPPAELITVEQFEPLWLALCVVWTLVLACVALLRARRGGEWRPLSALALAGPVGGALWFLYRARTAYQPETGIAGLHRVSVLLTNLVLFVAVGAALGILIGQLARRSRETRDV